MPETKIQSRVQHKHDTEVNWNKATNFIPKAGEIIIYNKDENYNYERFKIGNGETLLENLDFTTLSWNSLLDKPDVATKDYVENFVSNNAVLCSPQTLTEEQKAQIRQNIGITSTNTGTPDSGGNVTPEAVVTEYTYTYDGDTNSDAHSWITNYGDIKVFAKMGEVPAGEINLIGATVSRTNPNNQWLNKTFTITEEHLNKTLTKSGEDIPAVQDGLIQIYDMMGSDFSEFTVLCICTKPGWYNVTFDDWFEIINFPETGIYGYDKRTYGGNDYANSFTFTATTYPSGGGSGGGNGSVSLPENPIKYTGKEIQVFSRGICIGDSVTDGSFDNNEGGAIIKKFSYPAVLSRLTGFEIANAGIAGMTSQTWYEASLNSDPHWGKWVNQEWVWNMDPPNTGNDIISSTLDYSGFDFAIIHLGINDLAPLYDGSGVLETILTNFETYMNNIISKLQIANNGIKLFIATIIPTYATPLNPNYEALNERIKEIVEYTGNAYLLDLNEYSEIATSEAYSVTHPTALGYQKLATEIYAMISYIIKNNLNDFKYVQFIGTNYTV